MGQDRRSSGIPDRRKADVKQRRQIDVSSDDSNNATTLETFTQALQNATSRFEKLLAMRENVLRERDNILRLREEDLLHREARLSQREGLVTVRETASADGITNDVVQDELNVTLRQANEQLLLTSMQLQKLWEESIESNEVLTQIALYDFLTGLPNRRLFHDHLKIEISKTRRANLPLALLFLDLDGFKDVNDTLGHDMGDVLLKEAAERLRKCIRESDTVARLGGDEFTVILSELQSLRHIGTVTDNILKVLSEPFQLGEETVYVSASIGITLFPQDATEVDDLIRNADQAMYSAKQEGKNRYHYFTAAMQEEAIRKMRIINDLRGALEANQFEIVYQPIVEMTTGIVQKAEALIRWQHPTKGLINPVDFISAAEDTGMISAFGNWIFHEAARQATLWREKYHTEFQISVNISPTQFKKEGIDPSDWLNHLKDLDLPGQGIVVEITEGLLLDSNPKVLDQLLMLRDAGIEVALDDFGTGYSSLSYLKKFDIDYLKIDQAFVQNLSADSDDMALCEAIIVMAHKLGLKVIAEGVETGEQRILLASAGCDYGQGYLFSRPVTKDDFESLLDGNSRLGT